MCSEKVILGSRVRPSILGKGLVARILLFMDRLRDFEYSAGSGVKRVVCVLLVLRIRLFLVAQVVILSRYGCRVVSAVLKFEWEAEIVISSAYPVMLMVGLVGVGISER